MMKILIASMLGLMLLFSGVAEADHGVKRGYGEDEGHRCRNAGDPAKCEARAAAQEACKSRPETEQSNCIAEHVCADAKNPERCRANRLSRKK